MATESISTPHFVLERPFGGAMVILRRTSTPFATLADVSKSFSILMPALEALPRGQLRLLIDYRDGPMRNDPAFEQTVRPFRSAMTSGFHRVAIVVQSAVGKLQAQRHAREDRLPLQVFVNERLAIAYLEEGAGR
jgi:hypothetical protein